MPFNESQFSIVFGRTTTEANEKPRLHLVFEKPKLKFLVNFCILIQMPENERRWIQIKELKWHLCVRLNRLT
jgi:hypothetical protein